MKTIQKIRWLFGFLSAILFLFLSLGWFLHHEILEKISDEAKFYGFENVSYEKIIPLKYGFSVKNVVLKGQERFITVDTVDVRFSWNSLFYQTFDHVSFQGVRFDDSLERLQSLIKICFFRMNERTFSSNLNVEGVGLVRHGHKAYLLPLSLIYDGEEYKKLATVEIHPVSDQLSGHVRVYLERNGQDLKVEAHVYNLLSKDLGISIRDCELIFQSDPYQSNSLQKYNLSTMISEGGIDIFNAENVNSLPFDLNVNLQFVVGDQDGLKIQGNGIGSFLGHDMKVSAVTRDQKLNLLLQTNEDESDSLRSALSSLTQERIKEISGDVTLKGNVNIPLKYKNPKNRDPLTFLFVGLSDLLAADDKSGDIDIRFDKFTVKSENYGARSVSGSVLGELFPFKTRGNQRISCEELTLPSQSSFKNVEVLFSYHKGAQLRELKTSAFGGDFHLHSFQTKPNGAYRLLFDLKNMDMSQALQLLEMPNLSGSGLVQGKGQIEYSEGSGLNIVNARFMSQDKSGNLSYKSAEHDVPTTDLKEVSSNGDHESEALAFQILKDLHYTHFLLDIVPEQGKSQAFLEIMGYNPEVLSGHPFHFKIKLGGNLDEIVKKSVRHLKVPIPWKDESKV